MIFKTRHSFSPLIEQCIVSLKGLKIPQKEFITTTLCLFYLSKVDSISANWLAIAVSVNTTTISNCDKSLKLVTTIFICINIVDSFDKYVFLFPNSLSVDMANKRIFISVSFWCIVALILFCFLQSQYEYHFYYVEQMQLFLWDWTYASNSFCATSGVAQLVSEFLTQFFIQPYAGAGITTFLLLAVGILFSGIVHRVSPSISLVSFSLLAILSILFLHFDHNYYISGTIAYILCLVCFLSYLYINDFKVRLFVACAAVPLLFFLAGSISILFASSVLLYELLTNVKKSYPFLIPLVIAAAIALVSVYWGWEGEFNRALLPDKHYLSVLPAPALIYYSWACLFIVIVLACLLAKMKKKIDARVMIGAVVLQLIIVGIVAKSAMPLYGDEKSKHYKKLDYYARTEQWDNIIAESRGPISNLLYLFFLNTALAEKGELADRYFKFDQKGTQGLLIQWQRSLPASLVVSDIEFALRNPAETQRIAFEGNVIASHNGSPRFYMRLVQTNLVYGAYPIAERYIAILEKTCYYKDWGTAHRRFLYNNDAVKADPKLGVMRRSIPTDDYLYATSTLIKDLEVLATSNPSYRVPIEYLGLLFLASKDMMSFETLLEKYYGTEVLPALPLSFQEAVIILYEKNPEIWRKYNVQIPVAQRYSEYRQVILQNKNSIDVAGLLQGTYGDTYWYYYMFK